ncbi:DUF6452 family protein [Psychroflexus maritimus]|uniref:Uncharacterized protein n=1 Tax=Psychroflexus maritimus TaxID=2714865 RepID=A0A967AEL7_9FLAO|nr:DUF6452 family protein [Psychroflexus maritimus]NGZ89848.1 hypothetical protein [Psychroflexus maritimus]
MKIKNIRFILVVVLVSFWACERDDICGEEQQATPRLIIEFYDINEPDELKPVTDLAFFADGDSDTLLAPGAITDIVLPLRTSANQTNFFLTQFATSEAPNTDELRLNYARRNVYMNRACGYKVEFIDFQARRIVEETPNINWIRSVSVQETVIEDEEVVHLHIFH